LILLLSFFTYKVIQKSDTSNKPETAASEGKKPGSAAVSSRDLLVATTTSLQDSGLLDVLIPVLKICWL